MACIIVFMISLPIDAVLPEIVDHLRKQSNLVLRAPTGAGKTTRVPPALWKAGLADQGQIVLLEPRRLAARAAARRMAQELGLRLGDEIGYQVRFERQAGPRTQILAVTPGILLRRLLDDPFLESVSILIFDEFHERNLDSDLALGLARLLQQTVRPELRIVVMSATLEEERAARFLGDCPRVVSEGRLFPVSIRYEPRPSTVPLDRAIAEAVSVSLEQTSGDILVFLPGMQEIRQSARALETLGQERDLLVLPLHGDLPSEEQDRALLPQNRRKVILSTNVAETSVTVEGISAVVDSGLARLLEFDAELGLDRLHVRPISRASADQRTGRAGRTGPGLCIRLWGEMAHRARPEQTEPEIRRVDLAGPMLHLLCLGEDAAAFPWLEPPRPEAIDQARELLRRLGAIDADGITALGRELARIPVHPRLGRLLLEGRRFGQLERAALMAALLSERDPFRRPSDRLNHPGTRSDLLDRVEILEEFERSGRTDSWLGPLDRSAGRFLLRARDQLVRLVGRSSTPSDLADEEGLLRALLVGYPDRVIRRREPRGRRGLMVGGRGVRLAPSSGVNESELFLGIDVQAAEPEAIVRLASAVQRDWLPTHLLHSRVEVFFDEQTERVQARKRLRYEDLILEEVSAHLPADDNTATVLFEAARQHLDRVLPAGDSPARDWLTRVRLLAQWMPELQLPTFGDDELQDVLRWLVPSCRSFNDLRQADWRSALEGRLNHAQRQAVEREAPERLEVPSGSQIRLQYEEGRPPILAVRIQELFGLRETPRIAGGRVKVLLHLLAPNYRPQQITEDLANFWSSTYALIRKELRARYPRHAWPEDPLSAEPERRPKRKG